MREKQLLLKRSKLPVLKFASSVELEIVSSLSSATNDLCCLSAHETRRGALRQKHGAPNFTVLCEQPSTILAMTSLAVRIDCYMKANK